MKHKFIYIFYFQTNSKILNLFIYFYTTFSMKNGNMAVTVILEFFKCGIKFFCSGWVDSIPILWAIDTNQEDTSGFLYFHKIYKIKVFHTVIYTVCIYGISSVSTYYIPHVDSKDINCCTGSLNNIEC